MSKLTTEGFTEAMPHQMDLFSALPTQVACTGSYLEEIRPISQISGGVPIEFRIQSASGLDYIDMQESEIYVKLKVKRANGDDLQATDKVGPVNLFLPSLFTSAEVTLQNKVTMTCNHYSYLAMIQNLLYKGEDSNLSLSSLELFVKDDWDGINDTDPAGSNSGLMMRNSYIKLSKVVDMCGPIYHPLFNLGRYLLNQVDVKLKLYRSSPSFCLSANDDSPSYVVELIDVCLLAKKIQVNPAVLYGHAQMLKEVHAKYPYTLTECRLQSIAAGSSSFHWDSVFQSKRPAKVVVCLVEASAVSGNYKSNPYNFQHCNISEICLYADGVPVGGAPLELNFSEAHGQTIARAYSELFRFAGKWKKDSGNDISKKDFTNGNALFVFQLEPFYDGQNAFANLIKTGNVRLTIQFATALQQTMTCIVYSETPAIFQITQERDIIVD